MDRSMVRVRCAFCGWNVRRALLLVSLMADDSIIADKQWMGSLLLYLLGKRPLHKGKWDRNTSKWDCPPDCGGCKWKGKHDRSPKATQDRDGG